MSEAPTATVKDVAFYYPGHIWRDDDWIKNLLIFFDGVGLLVPEYKAAEIERIHPHIAAPLKERGLLHYLVADRVVDKDATERMAKPILELIESGRFDHLPDEPKFHSISYSRLGYFGDERLADEIHRRLIERGLARQSEDGKSIPIHPIVRYVVLSLLAQILRGQRVGSGLDLSPTTDRPELIAGLTTVLGLAVSPTAGSVVEFDLQTVGVDLSLIPIDEVLSFRSEHGASYRRYAQSVRRFTWEISAMPEVERARAMADRRRELDDLASDLQRTSRQAWRAPAAFALGFAGVAWTAFTGEWIASVLGGAALVAGGVPRSELDAGAFSYLFEANAA